MKNNDLIVLYGPPWFGASQMSKHHLASYHSKKRKVLYIEVPINPLSFLTRTKVALKSLKTFFTGPLKLKKNLWLHTYFYLLPYRGSELLFGARWVNSINQWFVSKFLFYFIKKLGLHKPIIVVGTAHAYDLLNKFNDNLLIYHCSDDYTFVPTFPKSFAQLEIDLFKKCDFVIATAEELMKSKSNYNSKIYTVPNGADISHFLSTQDNNKKISHELKNLEGPIIGYIGSIFDWLDKDWIFEAAKAHPDWNFIFIGPIETDISFLKNTNNIHFFGPRPYSILPEYLKGFNVATIPFVFNDVTLRASPIKFYEYLASGIPIVSTNLPDLRPMKDYAYLANNSAEYIEFLNEALNNDSDKMKNKRMEISRKFSWSTRFEKIDHLIDKNLNKQI